MMHDASPFPQRFSVVQSINCMSSIFSEHSTGFQYSFFTQTRVSYIYTASAPDITHATRWPWFWLPPLAAITISRKPTPKGEMKFSLVITFFSDETFPFLALLCGSANAANGLHVLPCEPNLIVEYEKSHGSSTSRYVLRC